MHICSKLYIPVCGILDCLLRSNPSVPVAIADIQNHSHKHLRGGATVAPRLVISRDAWRVQKTKKLSLKVVGTGPQNGFCNFQLFYIGKYRENGKNRMCCLFKPPKWYFSC